MQEKLCNICTLGYYFVDYAGAEDSDQGRQVIGDQARVLMTHFISERMAQEGLSDQIREDDLYEPGTPRGMCH